MNDFHRSLDRAIARSLGALDGAPLENRYFMPEPLENPSGIPGLSQAWQDLGYVDEVSPLVAIQGAINDHVAKMAALGVWAIDRTTAYDVVTDFDTNSISVVCRNPEPLRFYSDDWVTRYMAGVPGAPDLRPTLAEQEIPAEGTE